MYILYVCAMRKMPLWCRGGGGEGNFVVVFVPLSWFAATDRKIKTP